MARRDSKQRNSPPPAAGILPAPHDQVYGERDTTEDRLISTLLHAGEALAAPMLPDATPRSPANTAAPQGYDYHGLREDAADLARIARQISDWIAAEPRRSALLGLMPSSFGDAEALRMLCANLFGLPAKTAVPDQNGRAVLSRREVEVLRLMSTDIPHESIADRLGISVRTVNRHTDRIYHKLGVNRPMQAVSRAIAMGYLEIDVLDLIEAAAGCTLRNFTAFHTLCAELYPRFLNGTPTRSLAEFGLLLLALCGATGKVQQCQRSAWLPRGSTVCELSPRGEIVQSFGADHLSRALGVCIIPDHAARHGFTPGNLLVSSTRLPPHQLNLSEIVEFTPEGRFVRAFCGGAELGTRLNEADSPIFGADGRLLVVCRGIPDAILAFAAGGKAVTRFAGGCCGQICVSPTGCVYATQQSGVGCIIKVFDPTGCLIGYQGGVGHGGYYSGLALDSRSHLFINRSEGDNCLIEEFDADGNRVNAFTVAGLLRGPIALDRQDRLYVPCPHTNDIKVVSTEGRVLRRIPLGGQLVPYAVAVTDSGRLWVTVHTAIS